MFLQKEKLGMIVQASSEQWSRISRVLEDMNALSIHVMKLIEVRDKKISELEDKDGNDSSKP